MTAEYDWASTCEHAVALFNGQTPGIELEQTLIGYFLEEPQRVTDHIEDIGRRIGKGENIRSGWAILKLELEHRPASARATDSSERVLQLAIAENWIRNAGGYIDRETELVDELYDPHIGRLRHWPDTQDRIVALWREQRPEFAKAEREAVERNAAQAQARKRIQPKRVKCQFCDAIVRNDFAVCAEHRHLIVEDHRYSEPPDDDWVEQQAAIQAEHEAA